MAGGDPERGAAHQLLGTIYYQQGADIRTSRIVHQFDGSISRERLLLLDGERREYLRKGDEVQCLLPNASASS